MSDQYKSITPPPHDWKERLNGVYKERNALVAALAKVWPSHFCLHAAEDETWDADWRTIVCIHTPNGDACWHIHDTDVPMFAGLQVQPNHWDGHTTAEKYQRLAQLGFSWK